MYKSFVLASTNFHAEIIAKNLWCNGKKCFYWPTSLGNKTLMEFCRKVLFHFKMFWRQLVYETLFFVFYRDKSVNLNPQLMCWRSAAQLKYKKYQEMSVKYEMAYQSARAHGGHCRKIAYLTTHYYRRNGLFSTKNMHSNRFKLRLDWRLIPLLSLQKFVTC